MSKRKDLSEEEWHDLGMTLTLAHNLLTTAAVLADNGLSKAWGDKIARVQHKLGSIRHKLDGEQFNRGGPQDVYTFYPMAAKPGAVRDSQQKPEDRRRARKCRQSFKRCLAHLTQQAGGPPPPTEETDRERE